VGDKYLWDDFAYATRDGLIGELRRRGCGGGA
jgi:catechol 1,2-dioxygenase